MLFLIVTFATFKHIDGVVVENKLRRYALGRRLSLEIICPSIYKNNNSICVFLTIRFFFKNACRVYHRVVSTKSMHCKKQIGPDFL